ncbi:MAG: hypothetical protein EBR23_06485, partial [Planctomycetia bacterium]|nr:hypothetical protein [Planctomycetia bacterium]
MRSPNLFVAFLTAMALRSTVTTAAAIAVSRPVDLQVVQRTDDGLGCVAITGAVSDVPEEGNSIEVRIVDGTTAGQWLRPDVTFEGRAFATALTLPAGGWYRLDCRLIRDGSPLAETAVDRVGVG